jgi:hypothetical protein
MSNTLTARDEAAAPAEQPGARVPDLFPFARQPLWFMLAGRSLKERAILEFLTAHINEQTGRLTAYPGISTIAEAVGLKPRAVQYAIDDLIDFGGVEVVPTFKDWKTGDRTFEPTTAGKANGQVSNTYTPCLTPPGGMFFEGPISLAEWYDERRKTDPRKGEYQHLIEHRIAEAQRRAARVRTARRKPAAGGVHLDAPPSEQGGSGDSQDKGGASPCTGGVHPHAPGGMHVDAPKEDLYEEDQEENSVRPVRNARTRDADLPTIGADGRIDTSPNHNHNHNLGHQAAALELLAEAEVAAGLARLDCRPSQRAQLAGLVAGVLADGHDLDQVRGYLIAKTRETTSKRITFVIRAFDPEHLADLAHAAPLEHADIRTARRAERHRKPATPAAPTSPPTSPVSWLDDQQFAALSPADRAVVGVTADRTDEQLSKIEQAHLHRIRERIGATAA